MNYGFREAYFEYFESWFCLPMPFRFRKHERHNLPCDVKNYDVSAEVIKNCVKYIFVGRCLLIFLKRQFLISPNNQPGFSYQLLNDR
jgi:hypothetical protein